MTHYTGTNCLSDFEVKTITLFLGLFCTCQQFKMTKNNRSRLLNCHIFSMIHFYIKIFVFVAFHILFHPLKARLDRKILYSEIKC